MSNSKSKIKKIICSSVLCLGFLASALTGLHFNNSANVYAESASGYIVEDVSSSSIGPGYNFSATTSSTTPVNPSSWKEITESVANTDNIKRGVVSFKSATSFDSEEWKLATQPSMPDTNNEDDNYHKNLMINSYSGDGRFGYKTDKSLTLEANSFYKISVYLYTHKTSKTDTADATDPRASIYLTGLLDEKDENYRQSAFEDISTRGAWEKYSFYVDTKEAKSVQLELWLGSKKSSVHGAVFFNNVEILRLSEDRYISQTQNLQDNDNDNFNIISFATDYTLPFENSSFEDVANEWTQKVQSTSNATDQISSIVDVNTFTKVNDNLSVTIPGSNCSADNQNALFLYNKVDGYQAVESSELTIKQQSYYKLSFWAKSDCNTGNGGTVMLVDKSDDPISVSKLTLATTVTNGSNKFRNDWTNYSFYIYGASNKDTNIAVQIWLGTQDSKTSGYVFVDDFRLEEINYDVYSANSSASNSTTFNLNNAGDKYTVANGEFNITHNTTSETIFPAKPANWDFTGDNNSNSFSGIVNTREDLFNDNIAKFGRGSTFPTKPGVVPYNQDDNNNVLMIGSTNEINEQTYTSNAITLSAGSFYNLSFYVMTDYVKHDTTSNDGARFKVSSANKTIFDLYNIKFDDDSWHKIDVKIKTGNNDESATIALSFDKLIGYVFFDKIELRTIDEATYNDTLFDNPNIPSYKVDLSFGNFNNNTYGKHLNSDGLDTSGSWNFSLNNEEVGIMHGVITSSSPLISDVPASLSGNTSYLYISSLHDAHLSYTSKESYTFNSETYYKISVNVLTRYITKDCEPTEFGASIKLTSSDDLLLKNINTRVDENSSEGVWKTYTIFASFTESLSSTITLSLGYTDETCMGEVLFDNLTITTLESDAYEQAIQDAELGTYATFTNYTAPEEDPQEETTPWENTFNWLIIPSLVTGLAIIIAVVGFYLKKINLNRKPKVKTNYDRRKTLDKDIDRREKIALRKQIIEELRAELSSIDKEIESFNQIAEEKLAEIKEQIKLEQEELKKEKLEIEIRKKEATANREKQLKESPEFVSNTKAEKEYNNFISKLDKQEMAIQKKISDKEFKLSVAKEANQEKLNKFAARQEYIRLQIAKIEAEIEEIAKQEEQIWAEYKSAKADAKRRKAEYKAQVKAEKEKQSATKTTSKKNSNSKTSSKNSKTKSTTKNKEDNSKSE